MGSCTARPGPLARPLDTCVRPKLNVLRLLLQILISESAYLIWILRCERVIQEHQPSENEIRARWLRAINTRLTNDKITATQIKREKEFTNLILNTWEQVLNKQQDLPNDWLFICEVLVGRR